MDIWYCFGIVKNMTLVSPTENALQGVAHMDTWDDQRILETLLAGQQRAIDSVRRALPQISVAAEAVTERLRKGGKLIYAGAGTSIRIAVQEGSELPATFGMPEDQIAYLIAGGRDGIFDTLASAEDDIGDGCRQAESCGDRDVVIAIAASGSTPFTVAAAERARRNGSLVIAVVNNPDSVLAEHANVEILLESGPEVIAGSTRLGAGTAQKAALNLLSTLVHTRLGAVHDGLMVNVQAGNHKLLARAEQIVAQIARVDLSRAAEALMATGGEVKSAILICAGAKSTQDAAQCLAESGKNLRLALSQVRSQ
jgi:N-acetylmuramic acid 6-phosphate etherase